MRTAALVLIAAVACGPSVIRVDQAPLPPPPEVAVPALGDAPPAPACLELPVPVLDGPGGRVLTDGERLVRVSDDRSSILVAWKWGGPVAVLARASANNLIGDFTVGGGHVYWSISAPTTDFGRCILDNIGAIYRVPIAGGKVETLVANGGDPRALTVADGRLYWLDEGLCPADPKILRPRWVERLDLTSRARAKALEDTGLSALAVEGDTLTVITGADVGRSDGSGGGYRVLAQAPGAFNLVVKNGRTFVSIYPEGGHPALVEVSGSGGAPRELAPTGATATVLVDDDTAYVQTDGELWSIPLAGGGPGIVAHGVALAGMDGDRVLAWGGANARALFSIPRTQRVGTIVATKLIEPTSFASDGTTLYWGDRYGGLWSMPLAGGAARKLSTTDTGAEHHIALAGDRLVFTSDGMDHHGPGAVGWMPKTGGKVTWLGQELAHPLSLAIDGNDALVGDGRGAITRYPLVGGAPTRLTPEGFASTVAVLVADARRIYFGRHDDRTIYAIDRTGGAPVAVGQPTDGAMGLALDGADLVVATRFDGIQRLATKGGPPRVIAASVAVPVQLAADATHFYWATSEGIERVPRAGGRKEHVGPGATAFAVTADAVYWSTSGLVHRKAMPVAGAAGDRVVEARDDELGPLAVVGDTVYFTSRTEVAAVDLRTGEVTGVAAPHRTPTWVAADAQTLYFLADERIWAIELAALPKRRAEMLAAIPNAMRREQAFDTNFIEPVSQTRITTVLDVDLIDDAVVWTTGDAIMRMRRQGGAVDALATALPGADWLAHHANRLYVTAKDGAGWAVYEIAGAGKAPTKLAAIAGQPRGLAVGPAGVVVSTETTVVRVPPDGGPPTVIAERQRGAGAVAVRGSTVYWMTRDGIAASDGCGPHLVESWPADHGILGGATLAATADGAVFSDPSAGWLVTTR